MRFEYDWRAPVMTNAKPDVVVTPDGHNAYKCDRAARRRSWWLVCPLETSVNSSQIDRPALHAAVFCCKVPAAAVVPACAPPHPTYTARLRPSSPPPTTDTPM